MTLTTSVWKTLHTKYKQRKPVHSSVFQFIFKTLIRANLAASYPLYTGSDRRIDPIFFFLRDPDKLNHPGDLRGKGATQTKSFTLILTQTYAMTQQIAVRDVMAVFHKGNVSF